MSCDMVQGTGLSPSGLRILSALERIAIIHGAVIGENEIIASKWGEGSGQGGIYCCYGSSFTVYIDGQPLADLLQFPTGDPTGCPEPLENCNKGDIQKNCCVCSGLSPDNPFCVAMFCCFCCQLNCNELIPLETFDPDNIYANVISCSFGFPLGSTFSSGDYEEDYTWDETYDDVLCQIESFPEQNILWIKPNAILDTLMQAVCCSPRPLYLFCTHCDEIFTEPITTTTISITLWLYFPVIAGSIAVVDNVPLVDRCIKRNYLFTFLKPLADEQVSDWQTQVNEFVKEFNFVNSERLKIMLAGFGQNIATQNDVARIGTTVDIMLEKDAKVSSDAYQFNITINESGDFTFS